MKISYLPPKSAQTCADSDPKAALSAEGQINSPVLLQSQPERLQRDIRDSKEWDVKPGTHGQEKKNSGRASFTTFPSYP